MLGVIANTVLVIIGSAIGILLKKGVPEKFSNAIMKAIGLCTIYIGISGALVGENTLVIIISMVLGVTLGELIKLDDNLNKLANKAENRFNKDNNQVGKFSTGLITATLIFCIGSMTIVGSLNAGLNGDNSLLFTKSILDLFSSFVLASTFGLGVLFASISVLVIQGGIVLLADILSPILSTAVVNEMTCVGSIIILALGLNLINVTKLKIANFLPAIFMPILLCPLYNFISNMF